MSGLFIGFFGLVALCAIGYAVMQVKDLFAEKIECEATVTKRYTENFPMTVGFVKRDRLEHHLTFRLSEDHAMDFAVGEELYKQCPAGTSGSLVFQGHRLLSFHIVKIGQE
ncbi:MAG: DUF2500 family protein [Oscillospiraceae bacterium]